MARFLANKALWAEIQNRARRAASASVAVAYLGSKGGKLLPLREGHRLVVDMSLPIVRQGLTNPHEVQALQRKGVKVFWRAGLHAKFLLLDRTLIVGSANVSQSSYKRLDEAALLTTDYAAVTRARQFFDDLCTQPLRPEYLRKCLKEYRAPRLVRAGRGGGQVRVPEGPQHWLLRVYPWPPREEEEDAIHKAEDKAKSRLRRPEASKLDWIRYPSRTRQFQRLGEGDIVSRVWAANGRLDVLAPAHVISKEVYAIKGQRRYLLMLEAPKSGQSMPWRTFRRQMRSACPGLDRERPRDRRIDRGVSDRILQMWTLGGRVSRKRR